MDAPDTPCPNPRVVMPRSYVPGRRESPGDRRHPQLWRALPPLHRRASYLRHHGPVPRPAAHARLAVAAGGAAGAWQSVDRRPGRHAKRGRRVVLALRHRSTGRPGQYPARPSHGEPRNAVCADPESAHWCVACRLRPAVDRPRIPGPTRRRAVPPGRS